MHALIRLGRLLLIGLSGAWLAACSTTLPQPFAAAWLGPLNASGVTGTASLAARESGVELSAHVSGLPIGTHALRLLDNPAGQHPRSCPDFAEKNIDPHWASAPATASLPGLEANAYGNARLVAVLPALTFQGREGLLGRLLVVEEGQDPHRALACGVIVREHP